MTRAPWALDRRRRLRPCNYLADPNLFGIDPRAEFVMPEGGDHPLLEIARVLHRCFVAWRSSEHHLRGDELGRRFGFSRQSWSKVAQGSRWPGHTLLAAAIASLDPRWRPSPADTEWVNDSSP